MSLAFWSLALGQDSKYITSGGDKCYVIPKSRQSVNLQEGGYNGVEWASGQGTESEWREQRRVQQKYLCFSSSRAVGSQVFIIGLSKRTQVFLDVSSITWLEPVRRSGDASEHWWLEKDS